MITDKQRSLTVGPTNGSSHIAHNKQKNRPLVTKMKSTLYIVAASWLIDLFYQNLTYTKYQLTERQTCTIKNPERA